MTSKGIGQLRRHRPWLEILEERVQLDIAPIGPVISPDNEEYGNFAFFNEINESYAAEDVAALIGVRTPADAERLRADLIQFVWKGAGLPNRLPARVEKNVGNPIAGSEEVFYPTLPNLRGIDRLTVTMEHGLQSFVYYFHPVASNQRLAVWQQGHFDDLGAAGGHATISYLLQQGYSVLALWMPMLGDNGLSSGFQVGTCTVPAFGGHDDLACLETATFSPMRYFVEPVAVALNHALSQEAFTDVAMIGLSGGGWTTVVYAALDPRVRVSIPVAGNLPEFLRTGPNAGDQGDWEQYASALYERTGFLDLYMLGAYGPNRRQLQVFNKFDDCCFAGVRFRTYLDHVKDAVAGMGSGDFNIFLDDSVRPEDGVPIHQVAPHALTTAIAHALENVTVRYVDDGENTYWNGEDTDRDTFLPTGDWRELQGAGFGRDARVASADSGASAVWQFRVTPGRYQVAVTWNPGVASAGNAPFYVYDGDTLLARVEVDQSTLPEGYYEGGAVWMVLGEFVITGTRLEVRLTNESDGLVIADGVRIIADPNREYVKLLYRDLLRREADADGLEAFTSALNGLRLSRAQVSQILLTSQEYRTLKLDALYRTYLRRAADAAGLAGFLEFLTTGGTFTQVRTALLASPEYYQTRGGSSDAGFLTALYQDVLGRDVDPVGQASFTPLLAAGTSRATVALHVLLSEEARRRLVDSYYTLYLRRPADPAGLAGFSAALGQGATEEQVIAAIVASEEYYRHASGG